MGLKCAPNFSQQVMEEALSNAEDTSVYLDDIGAFSFIWEHRILLLDKILYWLEANSFRLNANGPFRKLIGLAIGSHPLV